MRWVAICALTILWLVGCGVGPLQAAGEPCVRAEQCDALLACVAGTCTSDLSGLEAGVVPIRDAGNAPVDAAEVDAGPPVDSGPPPDTGPPPVDSGPPADSGPIDAGPPDSGPPDSGPPPVDAGPPDSGPVDAGPPDSGPPPVDSGPPPVDSGPVDAGL